MKVNLSQKGNDNMQSYPRFKILNRDEVSIFDLNYNIWVSFRCMLMANQRWHEEGDEKEKGENKITTYIYVQTKDSI